MTPGEDTRASTRRQVMPDQKIRVRVRVAAQCFADARRLSLPGAIVGEPQLRRPPWKSGAHYSIPSIATGFAVTSSVGITLGFD